MPESRRHRVPLFVVALVGFRILRRRYGFKSALSGSIRYRASSRHWQPPADSRSKRRVC